MSVVACACPNPTLNKPSINKYIINKEKRMEERVGSTLPEMGEGQ